MRKLRVLISFHYYRDVDIMRMLVKHFGEDPREWPEIFADSGGFSAHTQGAVITVADYASWLHKWKHCFSVYANLDAIGDAKGTWKNQLALESEGLAPLPVYHALEPWADLSHYLDRGYRYIALGGIALRPWRTYMPWLIECFKRGKGKAVFHGFGVTSWETLKALPWYSVDSSSWGKGFRWGRVPVFDEKRGRFVDVKLGDRAGAYKHAALVRSYKLDPEDFADRAKNDRAKICAIAALSYMRAEDWLRIRHGAITVPGGGRAVHGTPAALGLESPEGLVHGGDDGIGAHGGGSPGVKIHLVAGGGEVTGAPNGGTIGSNMSVTALGRAGLRLYLAEAASAMNDTAAARAMIIAQKMDG